MSKVLVAAFALWAVCAATLLAADLEQTARDAVAERRFAQAREIYRRLAAVEPGNTEHILWIARLSAWMKDYAAAAEAYDRALAREPRNSDALLGKAYVFMWRGRFADARMLLEQVGRLAPRSQELELAWARFCHYQALDDEAAEHVDRALSLDPGNVEAAQLKPQLSLSHPLELSFGYQHDWFSFFTPGNVGSASVGYVGPLTEVRLRHEVWDRFDKTENRFGLSASTGGFGNTLTSAPASSMRPEG